MKFTFGIITNLDNYGNFPSTLTNVLTSIANTECYDDVEIIIVGGNDNRTVGDYRFISFDENIKSKWITKKKNIITTEAKYDNIVYMHDYISLVPGWFKGMEMFGENFNICMTPMLNVDGSRFRDWTLWAEELVESNILPKELNRKLLLPYNVTHLSKYMYISGSYWIAKKHIMQEFPLDENLCWGQREDVIWSKQVRNKYKFSINTNSKVKLLKLKDPVFSEIPSDILNKIV